MQAAARSAECDPRTVALPAVTHAAATLAQLESNREKKLSILSGASRRVDTFLRTALASAEKPNAELLLLSSFAALRLDLAWASASCAPEPGPSGLESSPAAGHAWATRFLEAGRRLGSVLLRSADCDVLHAACALHAPRHEAPASPNHEHPAFFAAQRVHAAPWIALGSGQSEAGLALRETTGANGSTLLSPPPPPAQYAVQGMLASMQLPSALLSASRATPHSVGSTLRHTHRSAQQEQNTTSLQAGSATPTATKLAFGTTVPLGAPGSSPGLRSTAMARDRDGWLVEVPTPTHTSPPALRAATARVEVFRQWLLRHPEQARPEDWALLQAAQQGSVALSQPAMMSRLLQAEEEGGGFCEQADGTLDGLSTGLASHSTGPLPVHSGTLQGAPHEWADPDAVALPSQAAGRIREGPGLSARQVARALRYDHHVSCAPDAPVVQVHVEGLCDALARSPEQNPAAWLHATTLWWLATADCDLDVTALRGTRVELQDAGAVLGCLPWSHVHALRQHDCSFVRFSLLGVPSPRTLLALLACAEFRAGLGCRPVGKSVPWHATSEPSGLLAAADMLSSGLKALLPALLCVPVTPAGSAHADQTLVQLTLALHMTERAAAWLAAAGVGCNLRLRVLQVALAQMLQQVRPAPRWLDSEPFQLHLQLSMLRACLDLAAACVEDAGQCEASYESCTPALHLLRGAVDAGLAAQDTLPGTAACKPWQPAFLELLLQNQPAFGLVGALDVQCFLAAAWFHSAAEQHDPKAWLRAKRGELNSAAVELTQLAAVLGLLAVQQADDIQDEWPDRSTLLRNAAAAATAAAERLALRQQGAQGLAGQDQASEPSAEHGVQCVASALKKLQSHVWQRAARAAGVLDQVDQSGAEPRGLMSPDSLGPRTPAHREDSMPELEDDGTSRPSWALRRAASAVLQLSSLPSAAELGRLPCSPHLLSALRSMIQLRGRVAEQQGANVPPLISQSRALDVASGRMVPTPYSTKLAWLSGAFVESRMGHLLVSGHADAVILEGVYVLESLDAALPGLLGLQEHAEAALRRLRRACPCRLPASRQEATREKLLLLGQAPFKYCNIDLGPWHAATVRDHVMRLGLRSIPAESAQLGRQGDTGALARQPTTKRIAGLSGERLLGATMGQLQRAASMRRAERVTSAGASRVSARASGAVTVPKSTNSSTEAQPSEGAHMEAKGPFASSTSLVFEAPEKEDVGRSDLAALQVAAEVVQQLNEAWGPGHTDIRPTASSTQGGACSAWQLLYVPHFCTASAVESDDASHPAARAWAWAKTQPVGTPEAQRLARVLAAIGTALSHVGVGREGDALRSEAVACAALVCLGAAVVLLGKRAEADQCQTQQEAGVQLEVASLHHQITRVLLTFEPSQHRILHDFTPLLECEWRLPSTQERHSWHTPRHYRLAELHLRKAIYFTQQLTGPVSLPRVGLCQTLARLHRRQSHPEAKQTAISASLASAALQ